MNAVELHSGDYVERFKTSPTFRVARLVPRMNIGPDDAVLDLGCGTGMLLHYLNAFGSYDGVDFSADFIRIAKDTNPAPQKANFHCEDIVSFCAARPASFDVATTLDFSEHVDDATFKQIYSAIRCALKPGGKLYLHTPNLAFFIERAKDVGIMRQFPEHIAVRTGDRNAALIRDCGFENVQIEAVAHYNILKYFHPLRHLPLVGRYFEARLWITANR